MKVILVVCDGQIAAAAQQEPNISSDILEYTLHTHIYADTCLLAAPVYSSTPSATSHELLNVFEWFSQQNHQIKV